MNLTNFSSLFKIYTSHLRQLEIRGVLPKREYRKPITREYAAAFIRWWRQSRGDVPTDAMRQLAKHGLI